jgi:hypothetical protein
VPVYTGDGYSFAPVALAGLALLLYTLFAPGWEARRNNGNGNGNGDGDGESTASGEVTGPMEVRSPTARTPVPWRPL